SEGAEVVELGGCDLPPWPDINVKLPRPEPRGVSKREGPRPYGPGDAVLTPADAAKVLASTTALSPAVRALTAWHDRIERLLPQRVLRFIAHHPYVLAKKAT